MSPRLLASAFLAILALLGANLSAAVHCPRVFGSHMVLQRNLAIPVWGTADPGEKIQVAFAGQQP